MSYYIYKICCDDLPNYNYIGSTKAFRQRKSQHKNTYNKGNTTKIYNTIRENGGWDNWRMVILEELGEVSFTQARIKEEEHRVKLNANMNMVKCYRTEEEIKEYQQNNKEQKTEQMKEYYQKNKEELKEKSKEYREKNKEAIKEYYEEYYQNNKEELKEKSKEYREKNKEELKEKSKEYREKNKEAIKEYYENNKEQIKEWRSKKVTCECGCLITQSHINRHKKESKKHLELMKHLEKI